MKKDRIKTLDVAKGLCILQVICFHTLIPYVGTGYFVSISLPTFIFISGYFYKNGIQVLFKSIDKLVIPYFSTFFLFNIMYFCFYHKFVIPRSIWFLYVLFMCVLLYYLITLLVKNKTIIKTAIVLLCSWGGYLLDSAYNYPPFQMGSILSSIIFFHAGSLMSSYDKHIWEKPILCYISIVIFSVFCVFYFNKGSFIYIYSLCINHFEVNWVLSMIIIFSGIITILYISNKLEGLVTLNYMGQYSMIILCYHIFILFFDNHYFGTFLILAIMPVVIPLIRLILPKLYGVTPSLGTYLMNRYKVNSQ